MRGHALVIGSQTHGLTGVVGDAQRVAEALGALGFDVVRRLDAEATREGILQGYRRLIEVCTPDDAAFVYYAGHGAWSAEPGAGLQFIVPVDFERSTEADFRGITSLELSGLLDALTERTRNVTVVLDCCFAARMFRAVDRVPRALPEVPLPVVRAHLTRLQAGGAMLGGAHVESNPHAVRLVASALDEPAYEYTNARGVRTGLLTDVFLEVLDEARGLQVTWGQFGRRVRERVLARCPQQRPELEGPGRRLLFQLEELEHDVALAYYPERNHHWLRGGRLHRVHLGDEYTILPLGSLGPDTERALAVARVVEVLAGSSRVELERRPGAPLPTGAPAFPLRSLQPRRAVRLEGAWEAHGALQLSLQQALHASSLVRPAAADSEPEPLLARIRMGAPGLDVLDAGEDRIVHPLPPTAVSVPGVVRAVEVLARAQALRELEGGEEPARTEDWLDVEWGQVLSGRERRLRAAGACLHTGARIYVRLHNRGRARLHVSIFDVGVAGGITLLNTSQPSGVVLRPGRVETLGSRSDGALLGLELEWPAGVPREGERPESLVIIASETPMDLRLLETSAPSLVHLLQGAVPGGTRALSAPGGTHAVRYSVKHIRFWLDPRPPR
jgi:hypothetical protein